MADPFKNRINPSKRESSATFQAPDKEEATTGRFMPAGDDFGIGFRQPVGKMNASGMDSGPIPQSNKCMNPDDVKFHGLTPKKYSNVD